MEMKKQHSDLRQEGDVIVCNALIVFF